MLEWDVKNTKMNPWGKIFYCEKSFDVLHRFSVLICVDYGGLLREGFEWNGSESGGLQESRRRVGQRRLRFFSNVQRRRLRWRHVRPEKPRPFPGGGRIRDNGRPGCVVLPEHMGWVANSFCGEDFFLMRKIKKNFQKLF